ncbi:hypothetical protein IKW73_03640 [Candidatus Saccharibacteria bacterium]|nr:hypothetical protein [Candidatus Saccharibacteria bacterium]
MTARRKRNTKWISWIVIAVLLIAAGVVCYLVWDNYFNDKKDEPVKEETSQEEEKDEVVEEKTEEEVVEKEEVVQYEGEDPNTAESLTGVITYMSLVSTDFVIRVNIDQYLDNGTCVLTLSRDGGVVYTGEANIINAVSTSTCEGFNVPADIIGSGNINISIQLSSGGKTGVISGETAL